MTSSRKLIARLCYSLKLHSSNSFIIHDLNAIIAECEKPDKELLLETCKHFCKNCKGERWFHRDPQKGEKQWHCVCCFRCVNDEVLAKKVVPSAQGIQLSFDGASVNADMVYLVPCPDRFLRESNAKLKARASEAEYECEEAQLREGLLEDKYDSMLNCHPDRDPTEVPDIQCGHCNACLERNLEYSHKLYEECNNLRLKAYVKITSLEDDFKNHIRAMEAMRYDLEEVRNQCDKLFRENTNLKSRLDSTEARARDAEFRANKAERERDDNYCTLLLEREKGTP